MTFASAFAAPRARCAPWRPCWPTKDCREIVTQLSAANKALEQVGFRLIASGLTYCIEHPEDAEASGYPLDEVQRLFTKLASVHSARGTMGSLDAASAPTRGVRKESSCHRAVERHVSRILGWIVPNRRPVRPVAPERI